VRACYKGSFQLSQELSGQNKRNSKRQSKGVQTKKPENDLLSGREELIGTLSAMRN
jgi:hypothetical protein